MDSLAFRLDADKAGTDLLESIKEYFGDKKIEIIVKVYKEVNSLTPLLKPKTLPRPTGGLSPELKLFLAKVADQLGDDTNPK